MWTDSHSPCEGDLYKRLTVAEHCFELRYGYYEEKERHYCPPVVIYPDLCQSPQYTAEGYPLVTQVQDPCEYYCAINEQNVTWCSDCAHYSGEHREIGICRCEHRRIRP